MYSLTFNLSLSDTRPTYSKIASVLLLLVANLFSDKAIFDDLLDTFFLAIRNTSIAKASCIALVEKFIVHVVLNILHSICGLILFLWNSSLNSCYRTLMLYRFVWIDNFMSGQGMQISIIASLV